MVIKVERKEFLNALLVGATLAGRCKTLPVLDNVKIKVKDAFLQIVSMDSDSAIQKRTSFIECDEQGEFAVNASDLLKVVKAVKDDTVILSYSKEQNTLVVKHKKGNISLSAITTEDFPVVVHGENGETVTLGSETLFAWLNTAKSFVATDGVRPTMAGMYIEVKDNAVTVCASDGTKLFTDSVNNDSMANVSAIIPSGVLNAMQNVINGTSECQVTIDTTHTTVSVDDAKIITRNIDGRYPNFKAVIPVNQTISIGLNKQEFSDALSRVSICSNATSLIRMNVEGMNVTIDADNADFGKSAKEDMMCEHTGADIIIGFKHDSMVGLVGNIVSENITIQMSTPDRAMIVKDNEMPNKVLLTMPCLL